MSPISTSPVWKGFPSPPDVLILTLPLAAASDVAAHAASLGDEPFRLPHGSVTNFCLASGRPQARDAVRQRSVTDRSAKPVQPKGTPHFGGVERRQESESLVRQ